MSRFPWQPLLALILGMAAGLSYAWVIAPLRYVDTSPSTLRSDFKDEFRSVVAASYASTRDLDRARARLALLNDADTVEALSAQAQRMLAAGASFQTVQQMAGLASDLRSGKSGVAASVLPTATLSNPATPRTVTSPLAVTGTQPATLEPTATDVPPTAPPLNTPTPRPTATAIPTASTPFQLVSREDVCNANLTAGLMQISVLDSHRHQMPGVEIDISWNGGEESFFTGLKPEIADGYADYVMQPGVVYAIRIARAGSAVADLSAPSCPDSSGQTYLGGLKLVFQQP